MYQIFQGAVLFYKTLRYMTYELFNVSDPSRYEAGKTVFYHRVRVPGTSTGFLEEAAHVIKYIISFYTYYTYLYILYIFDIL